MTQPTEHRETAGLEWIEAACEAADQAGVGLVDWGCSLWEGGVRIRLQLATQAVSLDLHARHGGACYQSTPSCSIFARLEEGATMQQATERSVMRVVAELTARDDGSRTLPKGQPVVEERAPARSDEPPLRLEQVLEWRQAHEELADQLHLFAFIALETMVHNDLYPHELAVGEPITEEAIQESWRETVRLRRQGRAPEKLGIYVHVPYCTVECSFCYCGKTEHFVRSDVDRYVDRLIEEMETYAPIVEGEAITSVYFGGGTPSLLSPPAMRRVFTTLYDRFHVPEGTQVIFESNPDSLKPAKIDILADLGRVTRLTIGIQTLDPVVQKYVRRFNRREDIEAAMIAARNVGIPHVNFDCIAGLQGQTMESWQRDIRYLLSLEPDSIHLNGFRPLPRTIYASGGKMLDPRQMELRDEMIHWATEALADHGFGSLNQQGPHRTRNASNMQEYDLRTQNSSLLGFGFPARSHSFGGYYYVRDSTGGFVPSLRDQNADQRRYLGVPCDADEEICKFLVTNIRSGFSRADFRALFGVDALDAKPEAFRIFERLGLVEYHGDQVRFRTGRQLDGLVYRCFFYSKRTMERLMATWGDKYDRSEDYARHLEYLVPSAD